MKKSDVVIGKTYVAKVSNNLVPVRLDSVCTWGGWNATNTITKRAVHIKSAAKLRREYVIDARTPVERLSLMFSRLLRRQLDDDKMRQVIERNAIETSAGVCHSHDFCDANMCMHAAFIKCGMGVPDVNNQTTVNLWNSAWDLAKAKTFYMEIK